MQHWAYCLGFCSLDRRNLCWQLPCAGHQPPCSSLSPDPPPGLTFLLPRLFVSSLSGCPDNQNSFQFINMIYFYKSITKSLARRCLGACTMSKHETNMPLIWNHIYKNQRILHIIMSII